MGTAPVVRPQILITSTDYFSWCPVKSMHYGFSRLKRCLAPSPSPSHRREGGLNPLSPGGRGLGRGGRKCLSRDDRLTQRQAPVVGGRQPVGEYLEVVDIDPASNAFYPPVDLNDNYVLVQDGLPTSEEFTLAGHPAGRAVSLKVRAGSVGARGTRPGTSRTLRGAAIQIAPAETTQHAMARMKAS